LMNGLEQSSPLPNASTFCGRCEEVCPMSIPLPKLLRQLRNEAHQQQYGSRSSRGALSLWAAVARRPALYRRLSRWASLVLRLFRGRVPFAGGWTRSRDLPVPSGDSFMRQWQRTKGDANE